jgi:AmmeMemoRadiSam system protein B
MRLALPATFPPVAVGWRLAVALASLAAVLLFFSVPPEQPAPASNPSAQASHPLTFFDEREFARALAGIEAADPQRMPGAQGVIVPHHWLAGHLILGGLRDLAASGQYSRVILIGPNHVNAGSGGVLSSDVAWQTPFGSVEPDDEALRSLSSEGLVRIEPEVLAYEHSVAGIVPAIAYYLPEARVVPLALRRDVTASEAERLAAALAPLLDGATAVVATVDFSHYLPVDQARLRDIETLAALRSLDSPRVLSFGDEHLDSPASIALLMETMRVAGATRFELRENINSGDLGGLASAPGTSYIYGYYR